MNISKEIDELIIRISKVKNEYIPGFEKDENIDSLKSRLRDIDNILDNYDYSLSTLKDSMKLAIMEHELFKEIN